MKNKIHKDQSVNIAWQIEYWSIISEIPGFDRNQNIYDFCLLSKKAFSRILVHRNTCRKIRNRQIVNLNCRSHVCLW